MRKYLPGLIASLLAVTAVAFTTIPDKNMTAEEKEAAKFGDPCMTSAKRWFMITLECSDQASFNDVINPENYVLSNASETEEACAGSECICAIFACSNTYNKPIITLGTSIYSSIEKHFYEQIPSMQILTKDQVWARKSK